MFVKRVLAKSCKYAHPMGRKSPLKQVQKVYDRATDDLDAKALDKYPRRYSALSFMSLPHRCEAGSKVRMWPRCSGEASHSSTP